MNKSIPAILFFLFLFFVLAPSGATVTGRDLVELKKAGVSDRTIQLIIKEKVIETAALSVDEIVSMKKKGVNEKTLQLLIKECSFLNNSDPVVYGMETQSVRYINAQDIINLKNNGVSDSVIQSLIEATKSSSELDRERAWQMLENLNLRIDTRGDR